MAENASGRQFPVVLAAAVGAIGLCLLLLIRLPLEIGQESEANNTTTLAPSATPTATTILTPTAVAAATVTPKPSATMAEATAVTPPAPTASPSPEPSAAPSPTVTAEAIVPSGPAIIVDHTSTDITAIPQAWIEKAKEDLHIGYGHTSHGGQLTGGMAGLIDFANGGGLGLSLPTDIFQFSPDGNHGGDYLHLFEGTGVEPGHLELDVSFYPGWIYETEQYLGDPDPATGRGTERPEINVIMWAWCGQPAHYSEQQMVDEYLAPMSQLEEDYPGVVFVYMTARADGNGKSGTLHQRNQQIRDYCVQNDKVLYDFYDIDLYDPDGNYYGDKLVHNDCGYDSNGDGTQDSIWCLEWQGSHTEDVDWFYAECPHSYSINCNQKAYAAWWLWARLAGWDGN